MLQLFQRPFSLRKRLVLSVTGLLAAACVVIGVALPLILKSFLVDRLDEQLIATVERVLKGSGPMDDEHLDGSSRAGLVQPGQSVGTIAAIIDGDVVVDCQWLNQDGEPESCSAQMVSELEEEDFAERFTTIFLHHVGEYRATTVGDGPVKLIVGLPTANAKETVARLIVVEVVVTGLVLLIAAGATAALIGWSLRPLQRVAATAKRVSQLPLDRGKVELAERVAAGDSDPRTEAGQVGAAVNQLLRHVEASLEARHRSESQVRAFVADASHELRTPLAAIRGYAELTRRSRSEVAPDIEHALRRVESESARMTALVEDLLLLARLDSGRPLDQKPVDLAPVLINAVSDAHAVGPQYDWQLDLPDVGVEVVGDQARLHQVLTNLLANARTHTPPGTQVRTTLDRSNDGRFARIRVSDNGPGIAPDLLPTIFSRFVRGDSARTREKGSTGLGLAIVTAVVASHGGRVSVESGPGSTTFTVELPAIPRQVKLV